MGEKTEGEMQEDCEVKKDRNDHVPEKSEKIKIEYKMGGKIEGEMQEDFEDCEDKKDRSDPVPDPVPDPALIGNIEKSEK